MASIERKELLSKIETVAPALAENDRIQVLTHLCFTGEKLMAFNDRIAISTPMQTEFKGTVPGVLLRDLVTIQVHASKVSITPSGDNHVHVGMGKTKIKLATFPVSLFTQLVPPDFNDSSRGGMECSDEFFEAIDDCMQSVESNATVRDKLGITVIPEDNKVRFYSTTGFVLTRATLSKADDNVFKNRIILSSEFCKQMLANKTAEKKLLTVKKDHTVFTAGNTRIFGKLIISDSPINFEQMVQSILADSKIPKIAEKERGRLGTAIKLAQRVSEIVSNETFTEVTITGGEMQLNAASASRGEVTDKVPFTGHPDSRIKVTISDIGKQYDRYDSLLFKQRAALMSKKNTIFMVSAHG